MTGRLDKEVGPAWRERLQEAREKRAAAQRAVEELEENMARARSERDSSRQLAAGDSDLVAVARQRATAAVIDDVLSEAHDDLARARRQHQASTAALMRLEETIQRKIGEIEEIDREMKELATRRQELVSELSE